MLRYCVFFYFLLNFNILQAQDLVFSQFNYSPLLLNPALTGAAGAPRVALTYRNQWLNLPNAYTSYYLAADHFFNKINSGVGLSVLNDVQGDGIYSSTTVAAHYAYNLTLSNNAFLALGFEGAATQARVAMNRLVFYDQLSPNGTVNPTITEPLPNALNKWYGDVGVGAVIYSKRVFGGLALRHINVPNSGFNEQNATFTPIPVRLTGNLGFQIPIAQSNHRRNGGNDDYYLSPNLMTSLQGSFYQIMGGATARLGAVSAGAYARYAGGVTDALIFQVGFQKDLFRLGYSYDYTLTRLGALGGSHELSLTLNMADNEEYKKSHRQGRYNNCMRIFR